MLNLNLLGKRNNSSDSLKKRYLMKLFSGFFGMAMSLITQSIVPRTLGPQAYGDYNFLTNFFSQVVGFFDMGTSSGFYTKLSRRSKESGLIVFYFCFMGIVSFMVVGFVVFARFIHYDGKFWPRQNSSYIFLAAGLGIITWFSTITNSMTDAFGLTVSSETARVFQRAIFAGFILILFLLKWLNLRSYFYYQYGFFLFFIIFLLWIIKHNGFFAGCWYKISFEQVKSYFKELYVFSHPLFLYSLIGMLVGILDRWLLQFYGGSVQQGFYGLSYQIGAICFLFTASLSPLFFRELSIAFGENNFKKMAGFFERYIPMMYSITAYFACFIAIQSDKVVYIFGGKSYKEAVIVVAIMAFYPIHQTYGQLSSSVLLSMEKTKLYRNIGIVMALIGLPITYFLIAPVNKMGLGAGAVGLAIKMILMQFLTVNIQLFYNAKFLQVSFWKFLVHQILSIAIFLLVAFLVTFGVEYFLGVNVLLRFLVEGFIYTIIIAFCLYYFPGLVGLNRTEMKSHLNFLFTKMSIKN